MTNTSAVRVTLPEIRGEEYVDAKGSNLDWLYALVEANYTRGSLSELPGNLMKFHSDIKRYLPRGITIWEKAGALGEHIIRESIWEIDKFVDYCEDVEYPVQLRFIQSLRQCLEKERDTNNLGFEYECDFIQNS